MKLFSWNKVSYWLEPVVALYKDSYWWEPEKGEIGAKGFFLYFGEEAGTRIPLGRIQS